MSDTLDAAILRILKPTPEGATTVGAGFLVASQLAVTCAHVINAAGSGPGKIVSVCFYNDSTPRTAVVLSTGWSPADEDDLAFLRLSTVPKNAQPLTLGRSEQAHYQTFTSLGFPHSAHAKARAPEGKMHRVVPCQGRKRAMLELEGVQFDPGMSGAPVFADGLVMGVINCGQDLSHWKVVYATTTETLAAYQPRLQLHDAAPVSLPPLPARGELLPPGNLPSGHNLTYPRNAAFTGREADLLALADALLFGAGRADIGQTDQVNLLYGLGGVGKTQLAVEFCYRFGRCFEGVHWVQAANPDAIASQIAGCGLAMGLTPWPDTTPEQLALTLRAWQSAQRRLVIFDNLEDPAALAAWLPRLGAVRLLVTARRVHWPPELGLSPHPLDTLARPEALALLRKLAPRLTTEPDDLLDMIAARLGDLPLALDLAGRYLHEARSVSPQDYLTQLDAAGSILDHPSFQNWAETSPTNHLRDLVASFELSFSQLDDSKPADALATRLFALCGYCAPNTPIPPDLLREAIEEEARGPLFDRALLRLANLGLLDGDERGPAMHPLAAEYAQRKVGGKAVLESLANALAAVSSRAYDSGLPANFRPLRPHLEYLAPRCEEQQLATAAALWNSLARCLQMFAEYSQARDGYQRALQLAEAANGLNHSTVAVYANDLGLVLKALGDMQGAKQLYERALHIGEAAHGLEHSTVAVYANNLGWVLQALGDLPAAKQHIERALRIGEQVYGPDHPQVAIYANNLGGVLKDLGDLTGAKQHYERALRIDEAAFGPEHPKVAIRANNLGGVLKDLGDLTGAKLLYERALRIDEAAFGPDHPNVARDASNLGNLLRVQGDLNGAKQYIERALSIDEVTFAPDHPNVAIRALSLGAVLNDMGDLPAAEQQCARALRIFEQFLPPSHPNIQAARSWVDGIRRKMGKPE